MWLLIIIIFIVVYFIVRATEPDHYEVQRNLLGMQRAVEEYKRLEKKKELLEAQIEAERLRNEKENR